MTLILLNQIGKNGGKKNNYSQSNQKKDYKTLMKKDLS